MADLDSLVRDLARLECDLSVIVGQARQERCRRFRLALKWIQRDRLPASSYSARAAACLIADVIHGRHVREEMLREVRHQRRDSGGDDYLTPK